MRKFAAIAVVFWAAVAASVAAQTPEQAASIAEAERVGRLLYEHDRAAWLATDAMLAEFGENAPELVRGWVAEDVAGGIVLTFTSRDGGEARYRAVYRDGALIESGVANGPLTEYQRQLYRARQLAGELLTEPCTERYNTVVLPRASSDRDEADADVDVYFMPGTSDPGAVIIGGYFRYGVNVDHMRVVEQERFANSCLTLRRDDPSFQGRAPAMLVFIHVLSETPTETHVFINLTQGVPLTVAAGGEIWIVREGRISRHQRRNNR